VVGGGLVRAGVGGVWGAGLQMTVWGRGRRGGGGGGREQLRTELRHR